MAKMTKASLKGLIKECLVELLSDGLGVPQQSLTENRKPRGGTASHQQQHQPQRQQKRPSIFDQMDNSFQRHHGNGNNGNNVAVSMATLATDDSVLQGLLAETANTTYLDRMKHEINVPSVPYVSRPSLPGQRDEYGMDQQSVSESTYVKQPQAPVQHQAAAGLDINALFGDATANWGEVLERSTTKKLP